MFVNLEDEEEFELPDSMAGWRPYGLPSPLLKGLAECGFHEPTGIQKRSLQAAVVAGTDIVASAQTGSGKVNPSALKRDA